MYRNNPVVIKLNDNKTDCREINKEVPQGCPLSPTIFSICTNEIVIIETKYTSMELM
jgi:hypothetical protein